MKSLIENPLGWELLDHGVNQSSTLSYKQPLKNYYILEWI